MDSFESVVATILEKQGYWVKSSFKVDLTKEEKRKIEKYSAPRWELDLLAYKGSKNEILVVECKSYLDSTGVRMGGFDGSRERDTARYKLFNDERLRNVVFARLTAQLEKEGSCSANPMIVLALAAGKIASESDRHKIKQHFDNNGWLLFDDSWLKENLSIIAKDGYENAVASVVAKLLLRT